MFLSKKNHPVPWTQSESRNQNLSDYFDGLFQILELLFEIFFFENTLFSRYFGI